MPIRWRLTIFNALVIGGILLALGCALFFLLRQTLLSSVEDTARKQALAAAKEIDSGEGLDEEDGRLVLDEGLKEGLTHDGVFIVVRNGRGDIITQTVNLPNNGEVQDELWRRVLETGKPEYDKFTFREEDPSYVYAVPVSPPEQPARIVEVGKFYEPAQEIVDRDGARARVRCRRGVPLISGWGVPARPQSALSRKCGRDGRPPHYRRGPLEEAARR